MSPGVPYKSLGAVILRQVAGTPVSAEWISLSVRIANTPPSGINRTEYVTIVAASCDKMSHDFILCAPTVQILVDRDNESSVTSDGEPRDSGDEAAMSGRVSVVSTRGQAERADRPQVTGSCDDTTPTEHEPRSECPGHGLAINNDSGDLVPIPVMVSAGVARAQPPERGSPR